jgi:hypothetical protein
MKKTIKCRTVKLSLSPETLRRLTVPELGRAQGGNPMTVSECVAIDDNTKLEYTGPGCVNRSRGTCMACG